MESSAERELEWAGVRQAFVHRRQWRFWNGELKIRQEEITKNGAGSEMIVGRNKDGKI